LDHLNREYTCPRKKKQYMHEKVVDYVHEQVYYLGMETTPRTLTEAVRYYADPQTCINAVSLKLRVHYETRIQSIDQLVIAKSGPRLKQWPAEQKPRGTSWGGNQIAVQGGGMDQLVMCLSDVLSRRIVDKTGLTGNYDIDLKWTPDDQQGTSDAGPTLFTALAEQLGLKLDATKGPVDTLVVDHVERPTEN
jgi:uncharacterized protein (TIGR03435 family)